MDKKFILLVSLLTLVVVGSYAVPVVINNSSSLTNSMHQSRLPANDTPNRVPDKCGCFLGECCHRKKRRTRRSPDWGDECCPCCKV